MTHLEQLVYEYYDWLGYLVKHNIKVGRRKKGGWKMELDIIAYNPTTNHLVHVEPSVDGDSWKEREMRFKKKFELGKKYILGDIFKWLKNDTAIEQIAILVYHPKNKDKVGGGQIKSIDEFARDIRAKIRESGLMSSNAIPEQYPLLRTIQLITGGYYRKL
ncbi:MAG: hypothetical protein Q8M83_04580 [bacterium]|nr:hypothetical protein [bacterium]